MISYTNEYEKDNHCTDDCIVLNQTGLHALLTTRREDKEKGGGGDG